MVHKILCSLAQLSSGLTLRMMALGCPTEDFAAKICEMKQLALVSRRPIIQSVAFKASDALPASLLYPEYFLRPSQLVRRVRSVFAQVAAEREVTLPWGAPLVVDPSETIGENVSRTGVYDLVVLEAIARLADSGELALDVGANIGLMTSALASSVGTTGRVLSFEPHPLLIEKLQHNVELWRQRIAWHQVAVYPVALSDEDGSASLVMPADFSGNQGRASLEDFHKGDRITIQTKKLDGLIPENDVVGVMKMDVEGHEYRTLNGALSLLANGRIRDIIFEEYEYPSAVVRLLESHGYNIFGLRKTMFGPQLISGPALAEQMSDVEPPNYIATRDPQRAQLRFTRIGWHALRRRVMPRIPAPGPQPSDRSVRADGAA